MTIMFGKFKGVDTSEVPFSYLVYLFEADWIKEDLFESVKQEMADRLNISASADIESGKLKWAYKTMANKFHPDKKGGSHEAMIAINEFYEILK